jgi:hypothetical protein
VPNYETGAEEHLLKSGHPIDDKGTLLFLFDEFPGWKR